MNEQPKLLQKGSLEALDSGGYSVRVARSIEELEALRPAWLELQGSFVTTDLDYYLTVLRHKPGVRRPHVVLLERDGRPELMIVGRIEDANLTFRLGYRKIYNLRFKALAVVYGGFLGEVGQDEAELLVDQLLATLARGEAEAAILAHLSVDEPLYAEARRRPRFLAQQHGSRLQPCWRLYLPESLEEFLRSRSPRTREGMRRQARRLENRYGDSLTLERFRDRDQLDRLFADAEQVAAKTYQWQLGVAFRDTPFQRTIAELAMDKGWFRAYVLYLEGRPVAFWHGLAYEGIFRTGTPAYDPSLAGLSVGNYVLMRMIEDLCADDSVIELDHGFGDAEYKRRFGDEARVEGDILIFAPSLRGARINLVITVLLAIESLASRILGRRELRTRLKRAWRRRLVSKPRAR